MIKYTYGGDDDMTTKSKVFLSIDNLIENINLSRNYLGKPVSITLVDDTLECYMSYIYSKNNEIFKYHISFEPLYANNPNNLNQVFLPYKTQFEIFYSFLHHYMQYHGKENHIYDITI